MYNVHIQIYPILDRLSLLCEYLVSFWDSVLETIEQNVKLIETLETSASILFRTFCLRPTHCIDKQILLVLSRLNRTNNCFSHKNHCLRQL